jgi:dipeptidyl aminopeptidase/acylaminoacyl peptidase
MAEKRVMKVEDLLNIKWAGDPQISPDGKKIIYVGTSIDRKPKPLNPNCGKFQPVAKANRLRSPMAKTIPSPVGLLVAKV